MEHWDLRTHDLDEHHPAVLDSRPEGRAILLALPAGERMQEHQVFERAWVMVVDGEVEITAGESEIGGGPGLLVGFEPKERHEVHARTDARLLLVLAPWPGEGRPPDWRS